LRIAMVGTRGIPARYGGFETAVEEIGSRLARKGHDVVVYCRRTGDARSRSSKYLAVSLVHLPALRHKALETLSHTALSTLHATTTGRFDAVVVFNAANSVFLPLLRRRANGVATHVDGLEWKRSKWGRVGRRYYRIAEGLAVRWSDALICDAQGIADYYRDEFAAQGDVIAYGAPILQGTGDDRLAVLGVHPGRYHLVVARFEPENHVDVAVEGYLASRARNPLIVVGTAPYADDYTRRVRELAAKDARIRLVGAVWDQDQLNQLYANACSYIHGHSVGGTNPSLLRAMGAGAAVLAFDVTFNRETLGSDDGLWSNALELAAELEAVEADPTVPLSRGQRSRTRAATVYRWDDVADAYERLCRRLAAEDRISHPRPGLVEIVRR
jgi:glycosyltransferase involved in cell wall biosynthesis